MHKPRVLVFIDWYLPGTKAGGPVRSLVNLVDHLRERIDFHIVTSDTDYTDSEPYAGIAADRWTELPGGEKVWYASNAGTRRREWRRLLREQPWDAIYINGIYSRRSSIAPLWLSRGMKTKRIVAVRGMLAAGPMRHGWLKKRAFLLAARILGLFRGVRFQATHTGEADEIKRWMGPNAEVRLVPNLPRMVTGVPMPRIEKRPGELRLVGVGRIAVEKNIHFAIECLRSIKGEVTYDLFGPVYDPAYWERCRRSIATLPANVNVDHKGIVAPEQVPALFARYHALFMPSLGENFGHAMAEAMAAGLPLVISDRTPWRGLEENMAGWDLELADKDRFTGALDRLCRMSAEEYHPWEAGAIAFARRSLGDPQRVQQTFALFTA